MGWIGSGGLILEKPGEAKEYAKNILHEKNVRLKWWTGMPLGMLSSRHTVLAEDKGKDSLAVH